MTFVPTKEIDYAESQVGVQEIPMGSNCQGYSWWQYGVRCPGGGWCMSFLSRCAVEGGFRFEGATHGAKGFSFTESAEAWARQRGIWRDKNWRAMPGSWVIFEFGGGYPTDHGELVLADNGYELVTIGGNTSNAVKYRKRDRKYVVGFVDLDAAGQSGPPAPPPTPQMKEHDMVILPGIGSPTGRRRTAKPNASGLFVELWNNGNIVGRDAPHAGDDPDMRRWVPKNKDGTPALTAANPLAGVALTSDLKTLVAMRKDGGTYDGQVLE